MIGRSKWRGRGNGGQEWVEVKGEEKEWGGKGGVESFFLSH